MPSDRPHWIRSQGLGLVCGQLTVLLLAVGSVVLVASGEGASRDVHMDDIRAFFRPVSWVHSWFYALLVVLVLYAVNTALCTFDSVVRKLRGRVRGLSPWGPPLFHVSFLLMLVGHLVGGLWTVDGPVVLLDEQWKPLDSQTEARVLSLDVEHHPDGSDRYATAQLELRRDGRTWSEPLAHNVPLSRDLAGDLWLLQEYGGVPSAVVLVSGEDRCTLSEGQGCQLGSVVVSVSRLLSRGSWGDEPVAVASLFWPGVSPQTAYLARSMPVELPGGGALRVGSFEEGPAVLTRHRGTPGHVWAGLAALLMLLGGVFMARRWT